MNPPLIIDYYTDILCVWAWIAQRRIEEVEAAWGDKVELRYHYLNLFGDTAGRMEKQWRDRGGYDGFSRHVIDAAEPYDDAPVNSKIWQQVRPATSANAHLVLKAVELIYSSQESIALGVLLRRCFFVDNEDIGNLDRVLDIADEAGFVRERLNTSIHSGQATAALMQDYQLAQEQEIKGSPSWIMNNGRQTLFGNVGYRVLNANIEENLSRPLNGASWC